MPCAMGVSAFAVFMISSLSFFSTNHAQPLPNCVSPAFLNCAMKLSWLPKPVTCLFFFVQVLGFSVLGFYKKLIPLGIQPNPLFQKQN